jgi:4-amino-4-deoxy-L-arabinose transferase-like glycosyltransferase
MLSPRPISDPAADPTRLSPSEPWRRWKQAGLVLLAAVWIALGLVGHDPWKFDDAVNFDLAWQMNVHGDYVVPRLAGDVYLARPPLVPAIAAVSQRLLSPPLDAYDAARVAAGLALAVTLLFTSLAAVELAGPGLRWLPMLILIGTVGLWDRGHVLSGELGAMTGVAIALYGLALALRRPLGGGAWLGLGLATAFLSQGPLTPVWIVVATLLLPACGRAWRRPAWALSLAVAIVVGVALVLPWIVALGLRGHGLLAAWVAGQRAGNFIALHGGADGADPLYYLRNILWFGWPAVPLIAWTLWTRGRGFNGGLATPAVQLPGLVSIVVFANLLVIPDPKLIDGLPLLVPLALVGMLEVDTLKRGYSAALDWFGILSFGLLGLLVWAAWIDARLFGMPRAVAALFRDAESGYRPSFHFGAVLTAVLLSLAWVALVRPARRSNRRAILNWAVGMTLMWCLYSTIWLPYLDSRRSYRHLAERLAAHLPSTGCVASRNLGDAQRALFQYFGKFITLREETHPDSACAALLVQWGPEPGVPPPGWHAEWGGSRSGDTTETFVLYVKDRT